MWASYQRTEFEDNFAATAFDADSNAVFFGADFSPWDNILAGVAFGYENTDVDTIFNAGNQDIDAISIIPYFGAYISEHVGVDYNLGVNFAVGYSSVDIDQFRTAVGTTTRVTSTTDSDRWFFSANVDAGQTFDDFTLAGQAEILVARDDMSGFTESNGTVIPDRRFELGRVTVGGEAAYSWGSFEPYVSAHYEYDYEMTELGVTAGTQPANDDDDVLFGVGVRWFGEQFTASFGYTTVLSREDFDSDALTFQVRGDF